MPPRRQTQHVEDICLGRPGADQVMSTLYAINAGTEDEEPFGSELSESVAPLVHKPSCEIELEPQASTPFINRPLSAGSSLPAPETFRMAARQDRKGVMTRTMPSLPPKSLEAERTQPTSSQDGSKPEGSGGIKIVSPQELEKSYGHDAPQEQQREPVVKLINQERAESTRHSAEVSFSIMPMSSQQWKHTQHITGSEDGRDPSRDSAPSRPPHEVSTKDNLLPQTADLDKPSPVAHHNTSTVQLDQAGPNRTDQTQTIYQEPESTVLMNNEARESGSPQPKHQQAKATQRVQSSQHATVDLTARTPDPPQDLGPPVKGPAPSEEDLFYLLMHRQRKRKTIENDLRDKQKTLEAGNEQLYQQNRRLSRELEAARVCHEKQSAELKTRKIAIAEFKARFSKLKDHVEEVSKQQETLADSASVMRQRAQALIVDKAALRQDLKELHTSSTSSVESLQGLSSKVSVVRACVEPLQTSLATAKQAAEAHAQQLSLEEHRNKRLETFVVQLSTTQNRYSSEIQDEQKAMLEQLRRLNKKVGSVQRTTSEEHQPVQLPVLDECVKMLKDIHGAEHIGPVELSKVTEKVALLAQSFATYQKSSLEAIRAVQDGSLTTSNKVESKLGALLESIKTTTAQQENFIDLREKGIRLEEQLKSSGDIMEVIRDGGKSAETREQHLRRTTDNLMAELKDLRDQLTSKTTSRPTNENEMITTWQIKYFDVSGKLAARDQSLAAKEKEVETQDGVVKELEKRIQDLEAERDSAVDCAHEAEISSTAVSDALEDLKVKLADAETKLVHSQLEIKTAGDERVAHARTSHAKELSSLRSEVSRCRQDLGDAQKQTEKLNADLADLALLRNDVKEASQLKSHIAAQETTIHELKEKQGTWDNTQRLLREAEIERSQQAQELSELRPQAEKGRTALDRVKALDQELRKKTEEIDRLFAKSKEIDDLTKRLEVKETEMSKLLSTMEKVHIDLELNQKLADQVPLLQEGIEHTKQRINSLAKELEDSRKEVGAGKLREQSLKSTAADVQAVRAQLREVQAVANMVPDLEQRLEEAKASASIAQEELGIAEKAADRLLEVQAANEHKEREIEELLNRIKIAESGAQGVQELRRESLRRDAEIQTLKRDLAKDVQESLPLGSVDAPGSTVSQGVLPSEDTMRALQEMSTPEIPESLTHATNLVRPSSQANLPRHRADRTGAFDVGASTVAHLEMIPIEKLITPGIQVAKEATQNDPTAATQASTTWKVSLTQEKSCIPESQEAIEERLSHAEAKGTPSNITSSLLSEASTFEELIEDQEDRSVYFNTVRPSDLLRSVSKTTPEHTAEEPIRETKSKKPTNFSVNLARSAISQRASQADSPSSRPPSSSYGGSMLLEQVEQMQNGGLMQSQSRAHHGAKNLKTTVSTREVNAGYATNVAFRDPSPRRLRSESQTRRRESMPLMERTPSKLNTPTRLPGILKETHQPNSAAKRRQEIEETSEVDSSQKSTKRLKRNHSAVEVKKLASKVGGQPTSVSKTHLNHPSLPTGSRKGSVIGTSAPAPGNAQQSAKKARKNSKNDRFAAQFNKATN